MEDVEQRRDRVNDRTDSGAHLLLFDCVIHGTISEDHVYYYI